MPFIDLHCDTIDRLYNEKTHLRSNTCHIDLSKLRQGDYLAQWFALYLDTMEVHEPLMDYVKKMHAYFMEELRSNDEIALATNYATYKKLKDSGKLAAFLSLEEGEPIASDLGYIDELYDLGVRMMTLTWNYQNHLGAPHHMQEGLTNFGQSVVDYLNHKAMLLDISHLSEVGLKEISRIYKKPIIASHCNARQVQPHTRNLSNEGIRCIADSGGIIGINFYSVFLNGSKDSTLDDLCRHIDYIYQLGGKNVLALGTDFDGMNCHLEVCNAGEMGKLLWRLEKLYPASVVEALSFANAERIIRENL